MRYRRTYVLNKGSIGDFISMINGFIGNSSRIKREKKQEQKLSISQDYHKEDIFILKNHKNLLTKF